MFDDSYLKFVKYAFKWTGSKFEIIENFMY